MTPSEAEIIRAALEPFAAVAEHDVGDDETDTDLYRPLNHNRAPHITIGHLRNAIAALDRLAEDQAGGREASLREAFETAHELIQEAKGADGDMTYVVSHLDFAEHWLNKAEALAQPERPAGQGGWQSQAAADVLAERRRQVEAEGWTPEHDDSHTFSELAFAASCYAHRAGCEPARRKYAPSWWPWKGWWKPAEPRRMLVKAAALILAEIERLDRAAPPAPGASS